MSKTEERIVGNLVTIRAYLSSKFPGYTVTEPACPKPYYEFNVENMELQRRYALTVERSKLSDPRTTPDRLWSSLTSGFIASAMVRAGEAGLKI